MKPIDKLLTRYADDMRSLSALARSIVRDAGEAEDVLQDVMLKLLSGQDKLGDIENPAAFLRRAVRNEAIDHLRRRQRELPTAEEAIAAFRSRASEDELRELEDLLWVKSYIDDLGPEMKQAFIEYAIDGYSIAEIARRMGVKPDSLRKRFDLVKKKIRRDHDLFIFILLF
ncbi:MAG: RNA polymerase sigma factor [Clostridia bacterium]|nr:RNA polymerase sigma factor [Clostridia bacterium]